MITPKQRSFWHRDVLYPPSCTCPPIRSAGWKESATNQPLGDISVSLPYLPSLPLRRPHAIAPAPDTAPLLTAPASPSRHRLPTTPASTACCRFLRASPLPLAPSFAAPTSEEVLLLASPFEGPRTWRLLHGGGRHQWQLLHAVQPLVQTAQGDGAGRWAPSTRARRGPQLVEDGHTSSWSKGGSPPSTYIYVM